MKIDKIYISAFGGLKDFTLELGNGLNVIYGNNEDGKSTVAAFIKAMFFGTGKKSQNLSDSVRQKYTPWDGSTMAGRIYFEHGGKNYCLEREFRKSDSTDRILLTDTTLGKQINTVENIGKMFFGMSAAAFERSLFIDDGRNFAKDSAAAGEINAKLSNIAVTGAEDISYQKIEKNLFDAKNKIISKTGRAGSYVEDYRVYGDLKKRLEIADADARKKSALNEKLVQKNAEYKKIYRQYTELKSITDRENDFKNREKLSEYIETKKELDRLNSGLRLSDGSTLDETFVKKVNFGINKYEKTAYRCSEIQNDIDRISETIKLQDQNSPESAKQQTEELNRKIEKLTLQKDELAKRAATVNAEIKNAAQKLDNPKSKNTAAVLTLLIFSVILFAVTAAAFLLKSPYIGATAAIIGVVLLVLAVVIKLKNKKSAASLKNECVRLNSELSNIKSSEIMLQQEINNSVSRINVLSAALNTDAAVRAERQADLDAKTEALKAESQKKQADLDEVFKFFSRYENSDSLEHIKKQLSAIESQTDLQKQLKLKLSYLSKDLSNIDYEQAKEKLLQLQTESTDNAVNIEEAKNALQKVTEKLFELKDDITTIATELKTSFKNSENPEDLKHEINEYAERLKSKKEFCNSIDTALEVLEASFYELRRGYGSELEKLTHSIFSQFTDGEYKGVNVTDTLDISVEKKNVFGMRESGYLSLGTANQVYLSLRLAIAALISPDDMLPIFLDDSLSQYDDARTDRAIKFLSGYCENGQGILFTCHNSVCDIASKQGIKIQKPYN